MRPGAMRRLRSTLLVIALIPLGGWEPLWRADPDVTAGNKAYAEGRFDDALAAYQRARDNGIDGPGLAYDQGTATLGKAEAAPEGDRDALYDEALTQLQAATGGRDGAIRGRAHYNRGNILMRRKQLDQAIDEYKNALRADPALESARSNLELALRQREKERKQQQQQGQGQGQPQQGQGQQPQPQQGQGQGQSPPPQQQPGQGQGQGQPPPQPPPGQQGQGQPPPPGQQGQGQPPPPGQQGQGQPPQPPPQGQGQGQPPQGPPPQPGQGQPQGGAPTQPPPRRMPQPRWPQDATEGDTPDTSQADKLDRLEDMSRQLRRSQVRDQSGRRRTPSSRDW